jgi:hypothetical protein
VFFLELEGLGFSPFEDFLMGLSFFGDDLLLTLSLDDLLAGFQEGGEVRVTWFTQVANIIYEALHCQRLFYAWVAGFPSTPAELDFFQYFPIVFLRLPEPLFGWVSDFWVFVSTALYIIMGR